MGKLAKAITAALIKNKNRNKVRRAPVKSVKERYRGKSR